MIEWKEQEVSAGMAPWMAKTGELQLFVQPWYGDGIKWRGIICHPVWTFTLRENFSDKETAMSAVAIWAEKMCDLK